MYDDDDGLPPELELQVEELHTRFDALEERLRQILARLELLESLLRSTAAP